MNSVVCTFCILCYTEFKSVISNKWTTLYLCDNLFPPVPSGTLGDEFLPSATLTGDSLCCSPCVDHGLKFVIAVQLFAWKDSSLR